MNIITRHKYLFLFLSILVALPFLIHLPKVKTVDNVDYFTLENHPDVLFYEKFKQIFGNDEFFVIAIKKDPLFTRENLELLKQITNDIEQINGVRKVKSLANVNDTIGEDDFFMVRPFLEDIPEEPDDLNKLKQSALDNPLYLKNFISTDGKTAAIVVSVYEKPEDPGFRKKLLKECDAVLEKYKDRTGKVFKAGWTTTNLYLSQYMKQDIATFIPITYILITLAVFFFFRNIYLTGVAVLNISICMGSTMGLFPIFGITLNNVTTIVPPLVMALALCDIVHIFSHLDRQVLVESGTMEKAIANTLKKVFLPCFLTTLTTAVGFISLYLSDIPPIKDFAVVASCGMIFEFFFSFVFMPPFLLLFNENKIFHKKKDKGTLHSRLKKTSGFVFEYYKPICIAGLALIIASLWLSSMIRVETNLLDYFKRTDKVRQSIGFVETNLAGIGTLDISLVSKTQDGFKSPENLKIIETIQEYSSGLEGVDKVMSFVDFIKDMNQSFHNEDPEKLKIPDSKALIPQYLLLYDSDDIDDFINESFDHARISLRLSHHSTRDQEKMIQSLRQFIDGLNTDDLEIRITGRALQDVNTIDSLVKGQIYSLATAACIIIVIMFFVLRSVSLGFLSIIPNLFPIILNFGIMGALSVSLNTATALIAAVAIGIAVDDTIHFLSQVKSNLMAHQDIKAAVAGAILTKGKAIVLSSLILCIGFGVMAFSRFVPTINFGALSAVIMITAVIGDILILPSAALYLTRWGVKFHKL
ncbi:efflux RND transporter permease subunit [Desulfobacter latus]|uniref:MMPL family transporter n=1 Tax=Desulfobacter latus TaxID=2292 RepID=A0A850TDD9_9BACT|nr:MMPL family transporter [Desulfobacter latus]NWH06828.1 MMPL family transporter [Desulfobacter latus]